MSEADASWWPAIITLAFGAVVGCMLVMRAATQAAGFASEAAVDLDERVAHLVTLLRDLEEQRRRMDAATYAAEKARLEGEAARALKARDGLLKQQKKSPDAEAPAAKGMSAQVQGFLWGAGSVGLLGLLFLLVNQSATPRVEGGSMTGNSQTGGGSDSGNGGRGFEPDAEMQALAARLREQPSDVVALVRLGHKLLQVQALDEAHALTMQALGLEPKNAEARVHLAILESGEKGAEAAMGAVEAVLADSPSLAEGWLFRGMLAMAAHDEARTKDSFEHFVATAPDGPQKERIRGYLRGEGLGMSGGGSVPPHPVIPSGGSGPMTAGPMAGGPPNGGSLTGGPMTGGPMAGGMGGPGDMGELEGRLSQNPKDVGALLGLAHKLLRMQRLSEAQGYNDRALVLEPKNAEARVHAAVLKSAGGDPKTALAALDALVAEDGKLAEAWFFRGMIGMQSGDADLAKASWEKFVAVSPPGPQRDRIQAFLDGKGLQMPR